MRARRPLPYLRIFRQRTFGVRKQAQNTLVIAASLVFKSLYSKEIIFSQMV
jgi:hypothetical protein